MTVVPQYVGIPATNAIDAMQVGIIEKRGVLDLEACVLQPGIILQRPQST
jgi:hypothetical protein